MVGMSYRTSRANIKLSISLSFLNPLAWLLIPLNMIVLAWLLFVQFALSVDDHCSVCLDAFEDIAENLEVGNPLKHVMLPCRHRFHLNCIRAWSVSGGRTCPVCRASMAARDVPPSTTLEIDDLTTPLIVTFDHPPRTAPSDLLNQQQRWICNYSIQCNVIFGTIVFARLLSDVLGSRCTRYPIIPIMADVVTMVGLMAALGQFKDQVNFQLQGGRSYLTVYCQLATLYSVEYAVIRYMLVQHRVVTRPWYTMRIVPLSC